MLDSLLFQVFGVFGRRKTPAVLLNFAVMLDSLVENHLLPSIHTIWTEDLIRQWRFAVYGCYTTRAFGMRCLVSDETFGRLELLFKFFQVELNTCEIVRNPLCRWWFNRTKGSLCIHVCGIHISWCTIIFYESHLSQARSIGQWSPLGLLWAMLLVHTNPQLSGFRGRPFFTVGPTFTFPRNWNIPFSTHTKKVITCNLRFPENSGEFPRVFRFLGICLGEPWKTTCCTTTGAIEPRSDRFATRWCHMTNRCPPPRLKLHCIRGGGRFVKGCWSDWWGVGVVLHIYIYLYT